MDFTVYYLKEPYMEQETLSSQAPPEHKEIAAKLDLFRQNYKNFIKELGVLGEFFAQIPNESPSVNGQTSMPSWTNGYLPQGDAIPLCGFLVKYNPAVYFEIGSGNSTKFARRTITHFNLRTKIISVDPCPRAEIDSLCDEVVRAPLQMVPVKVFKKLCKDSILFIDGSHLCLQNSDVTYMFMEVLPNINPGVILHFHDIFWPQDYPCEWKERHYNEQYLLGTLLLFGTGYEILYASSFIGGDSELSCEFNSVLRPFLPNNCSCGGGSLWMRLKAGSR
jgi:hypothetical protein